MSAKESVSVKPAGSCECVGYRVERIAGAEPGVAQHISKDSRMQVLNVRGKDSRGPRVTPTSLLLTEAYGKREPVRGGKIALGRDPYEGYPFNPEAYQASRIEMG